MKKPFCSLLYYGLAFLVSGSCNIHNNYSNNYYFQLGLIRDIGTSFQKGVELKIYIYIVKYESIVEPNLKPIDPEGDPIMAR
jgi:hypothetical protein